MYRCHMMMPLQSAPIAAPVLLGPEQGRDGVRVQPAVSVSHSTRWWHENGSDTDGYHRYHICFYISGRIQIRIRIISIMSDKI